MAPLGVPKWWRHQMETFSALLALCPGKSPVPVNSSHKTQWRGALIFSLICALDKRLSKQSCGWWFETPSLSLWRHCNENTVLAIGHQESNPIMNARVTCHIISLLHYYAFTETLLQQAVWAEPDSWYCFEFSNVVWLWLANIGSIWVRSRNCGCLVTWFCYQLIAKPGNKTATVSWPGPYALNWKWHWISKRQRAHSDE